MAANAWTIESIVAEVVRRLASADDSPPRSSSADTDLRLAERVVTMATVAGRLKGVARLVACREAVITPAVKDELHGRGITLIRGPAVPGPAEVARIVVCCGVPLRPVARQACADVPCHAARDLDRAVALMSRALPAPNGRGVLLTDRVADGVCRLNRAPHLRAAAVWCRASIDDARKTIHANAVVLDPENGPQNIDELLRNWFA